MTKKPYIYIGGSMRGRSVQQGEATKSHIEVIESVLSEKGYPVFADAQMKDTRINMNNPVVKIPKKYFQSISDSLVSSIAGLRMDSDTEKLRRDIAMRRWTIDLIERAGACIFDMSRSYTGMGVEIANALELRRQTLVLFSVKADNPGDYKPTLSALVNGNTSRLLTVRRWDDETVVSDIESFLEKVESRFDEPLRFQISTEMKRRLEISLAAMGFDDVPALVRAAIDKYLNGNGQ